MSAWKPERSSVADTTRTEPARSYCVRWLHYDDYIAHDLVQHVDSMYRTVGDRAHRWLQDQGHRRRERGQQSYLRERQPQVSSVQGQGEGEKPERQPRQEALEDEGTSH